MKIFWAWGFRTDKPGGQADFFRLLVEINAKPRALNFIAKIQLLLLVIPRLLVFA